MNRSRLAGLTTAMIEGHRSKLKNNHFNVLMLATANDMVAIAHVLKIPVGTVKSRLNRARKAIETLMAAEKRK